MTMSASQAGAGAKLRAQASSSPSPQSGGGGHLCFGLLGVQTAFPGPMVESDSMQRGSSSAILCRPFHANLYTCKLLYSACLNQRATLSQMQFGLVTSLVFPEKLLSVSYCHN